MWLIPFLCVKRQERRQEKMKDEGWGFFFEKCIKTKETPDELSHNDSKKKKKPSDESFVRRFRILPVFSIMYMIRIRFSGPRK